jgi:hypothetical protein
MDYSISPRSSTQAIDWLQSWDGAFPARSLHPNSSTNLLDEITEVTPATLALSIISPTTLTPNPPAEINETHLAQEGDRPSDSLAPKSRTGQLVSG